MKKTLLFVLFFAIIASSCESDDDGVTYTTPDYLSGKWVFSKYGTINAQNYVIYQDYVNEATCEADNLVLGINNTFTLNDFSSVVAGSSTTCENDQTNGQYVRINRDLVLVYTENNMTYEQTFNIVALTYNEITLSTVNGLGETVFYKLVK